MNPGLAPATTSNGPVAWPRLLLPGFSLVVLGLSMTLDLHHDYIDYARQWRRIVAGGDPSALLMASLSLFVPLTFYKVGHHQFYTPLFFLIPAWVFAHVEDRRAQLHLLWRATLPLAWISLMALIYPVTHRYAPPYEWIRETVGLPTFLFNMYGAWIMLRAGPNASARPGESG